MNNFLTQCKNYLFLPSAISDFEDRYLARMNRVGMWYFLCHIPLMTLIGWANGTGGMMAFLLTTLTAAGPVLVIRNWKAKRAVSIVMGVTAMFMGGLLVHFGQGPVQIEMHFYFFVLLALLAVYANPMVIVAAAVTAALHHALLWVVLPTSIFNYTAPFWVVAVHALFVVLESVAACFIARSFFDNVIGLEKIVAQRTEEVERRSADMKRVLDSVEQGILTIDEQGHMSEERSAALQHLLGEAPASGSFLDLIRTFDETAADWIELGLEDVFADIMPVETTIDQLPSRIVANGRSLEIQYRPVYEDETLSSLSVMVSDNTSVVEREKLEAENREMMVMIDGITKDKVGFLEFMEEAECLVVALREESRDDLVLLKRQIHTLKGNTAIFGLNRVAEACHQLENEIEESGASPEGRLWTELFGSWASARGKLRRLVAEEAHGITIDDREFAGLLHGILDGQSRDDLAVRVAGWGLESTVSRLVRVKQQARRMAESLGKGEIHVTSSHNNLKTDSATWSPFWSSLVHVIRNAVDHGLETPEDRKAAGKDGKGKLTLQTLVEADKYIISIADDGRGICWDRLKDVAARHGIPADTRKDLTEALFTDGVSTAIEVTSTSGRGVGMAAVRAECEALGGTIEVRSETGQGTEFRFSFPSEIMAPDTYQLLSDSGVAAPERAMAATVLSD